MAAKKRANPTGHHHCGTEAKKADLDSNRQRNTKQFMVEVDDG
jgi:hypothetical protein